MADAGVARDPGRLPWLEPYRVPTAARKSNRRPGTALAVGAAGLAAVVALLARDVIPMASEPPAPPQASVVLPAPADMGPAIVLPPLGERAEVAAPVARPAAAPQRVKPRIQRRIKTEPTSIAYRNVVKLQSGEAPELDAPTSQAAAAIGALPPPADPPRPAVNPSAQLVRGKTVQMGVYQTAWQAEAAWRSAIRDYTYLVTMPKSIEPISIRSKRYYRLQLGTPSKKHAKQLCTNLKTIGRACTVA